VPTAEICGADAADELSRQRTPPRRASPTSRKRERLTQTPLIRAAVSGASRPTPTKMADSVRGKRFCRVGSYGTSTSRRNKAMSNPCASAGSVRRAPGTGLKMSPEHYG